MPLSLFTHTHLHTDAKEKKGKKGGAKKGGAGEMPAEYAQAMEALEQDDFMQAVELLHEALEKVVPLGPNHTHVLYVVYLLCICPLFPLLSPHPFGSLPPSLSLFI